MNEISDEKLLFGLQSGNQVEKDQALKQLYAQNYPLIATYIAKNNGDPEDASDIFQDAIIVFYEKVRLGQLELTCSIQTYLYSVCRNLWLNRLRVQKRFTSMNEDMETIPVSEESLSVLTSNERSEAIIQLLEKLGSDCKKVLTFYYFERLKMREIAKRMSFANEQVAKNKKSTCMKKLKTLVLESPGLKNILK